MKRFAITALSLTLFASASASAFTFAQANKGDSNTQDMTITRAGSQASSAGPAQYFSGSVRVDPLFSANAPSNTSGAYVTFEPGARSAWHTHPKGQVLVVTASPIT